MFRNKLSSEVAFIWFEIFIAWPIASQRLCLLSSDRKIQAKEKHKPIVLKPFLSITFICQKLMSSQIKIADE
jgi:hypothetical protein